jgi:hypothetical protein
MSLEEKQEKEEGKCKTNVRKEETDCGGEEKGKK